MKINGIEQVNIGTEEKPFYVPKMSEEQKKAFKKYIRKNVKDGYKE